MNAVFRLCALLPLLALGASSLAQETTAPQPGLRLNLSPRIVYRQTPRNLYDASPAPAAGPTPLSRIKLFESGDLSAALGTDGKLHYRLPSPNFLGTKLSGQISTNAARLTLTWPPKN